MRERERDEREGERMREREKGRERGRKGERERDEKGRKEGERMKNNYYIGCSCGKIRISYLRTTGACSWSMQLEHAACILRSPRLPHIPIVHQCHMMSIEA